MSGKGKDVLWITVLSAILGLMAWHVIHWHAVGMRLEMLSWVGTGEASMTVLYNLGLVVVLGTLLGFLMRKITDVIS